MRHVTNVHGNFRKDAGSPKRDGKRFSRSAGMTNKYNMTRPVMRGGIRF